MAVTIELLMVADKEITNLADVPARWGAFLDANWSGAESGQDHRLRRSMGIRNVWSDVDFVLRAEQPMAELPLGFLLAKGCILANVVETHRLDVGAEVVQWNEYDNDLFGYGSPPEAFFSDEVRRISHALDSVNDEWIRNAFDPDQLVPAAERDEFTASDFEARVQDCQEVLRELKPFISRTANSGLGLVRFTW